jgi:hypothetical protein
MYGTVASLLERVERYFRGLAGKVDQTYRNNLKFHVLMVLAWTLSGGKTMPAPAICKIDPKKATDAPMKAVADWVFAEFKVAGEEDRTAKGYRFTDQLQADWNPAAAKI